MPDPLLPLQIADALDPTQFEAVLLGAQLLKFAAGAAIAAIAYQGYRRNESRPMLFVATGFVLLLVVPFFLYVVAVALVFLVGLPSFAETAAIISVELSQVLGLLVILYGLRV